MSEMARTNQSPLHGLACLIIGRNLGDAVIQSLFVRELMAYGFAQHYVIWTRPQVAFLFEDLHDCDVVVSPFPVGTSKEFGWAGLGCFLRAVRRLRAARPSVTLDLIGDVRERLFARLIGSPDHRHIGWALGHPFARIIRNPFGPGRPICTVPASIANVYEAHKIFLNTLTNRGDFTAVPQMAPSARIPRPLSRVGLHPFASQVCKLWPMENWRALAAQLQHLGVHVTVYGAPSERETLETVFGGLPQPVEYFTKSVRAFAENVAGLDLMIGLDSFSVHMAERNDVRSVMLNACNHPTLWMPPHCSTLNNAGGCKAYPCMNVPVCEGGPAPYVCIRSINVQSVLQAALSP